MRHLWAWLYRHAWKRLRRYERGDLPTGIPGHRDPENPCEYYAPFKRDLGDWANCETDGHYLCSLCRYAKQEAP